MDNTKKVRTLGILCLIFAVIIFIEGVIKTTFGHRVLRFDPDKESSMIIFQLILNALLDMVSSLLRSFPMYLGLAGYYFFGAIGKNRLAKCLLGLLLAVIFLDLVFALLSGLVSFLYSLRIVDPTYEMSRSNVFVWFYQFRNLFNNLIPLLAIAFGIGAFAAKKVSVSIQLIPIFAGVLYLFVTFPILIGSSVMPDYFAIFIYLGLIGFYLRGAIGENLWAKILFGGLLTLIFLHFAFESIHTIFSFLNSFDIGTGIQSSSLYGWFHFLGNNRIIFLPIISIVFGITYFFVKRRNIALQLIPIFAGFSYAIYYFIPNISYLATEYEYVEKFRSLFGMISSWGMKEIIWCLIGVAILRTSKLVSPFLISILTFTYLQIFALIFIAKVRSDQIYGVFIYAFFVSFIVQMIFIFYMWSAIDDGETKIKPWLAIGLGLVPILSFFWNLYLYGKFPQAFNDFIDRNKFETHYISSSPFVFYIILSAVVIIGVWIPYLGAILGLVSFVAYIVLIIKTCNAIARLETLVESNESSAIN